MNDLCLGKTLGQENLYLVPKVPGLCNLSCEWRITVHQRVAELFKTRQSGLAVVGQTFNPNTLEAEAGRALEFEASLVYRLEF